MTTALCKGQCKDRHMLGWSCGGPFRPHATKGPAFSVLWSSATEPWQGVKQDVRVWVCSWQPKEGI